MVTYEDKIKEVGEGVDHRDQEQGQQAREADLHPSTNPSISSRMEFAGTKRRAIQLKLTISSDRSATRSQAPASTSSRRASSSPGSRPLGSTVGGVLLAAAGQGAGAPPTSRRGSWAAGAPPPPRPGCPRRRGGAW
jgi:hypothetical protein